MFNPDKTNSAIVTDNVLPAILIGGPPNAGKSVLTYNLTQELRRCEIPHYVFRASADIEGDWFLEGVPEKVDQIVKKVVEYRRWTDIFRAFVCRDLSRRHLPLIVDLGGLPKDADNCIFQVCTRSILLLKDEDEEATKVWERFTTTNSLLPLAKLRSKLTGDSILLSKEPVITGTITGLEKKTRIRNNEVFDALLKRVIQLFGSFTSEELEHLHMEQLYRDYPQIGSIVHLPQQLRTLAPDITDIDKWTLDLLQPLLANLPEQMETAVYGRAPAWVYGALALHTGPYPFHQFDARLGWVISPHLQTTTSGQSSRSLIDIKEETHNDAYIICIYPIHNYLDYREADQLVFPEPPPHHGVIVSGKLPLWLFTALARFYAQRDVPWVALNDARDNCPIIIYSQVASHPIGRALPELTE